MKLLILLTLTWKFSFSLNSREICDISENGYELKLICRRGIIGSIRSIKDESVSCGNRDVLRESIMAIHIDGCVFNEFNLFKNCSALKLQANKIQSTKNETLNFVHSLDHSTSFEMLASALSDLPNLRDLDLSGYNLTLSESVFQGAHQLKVLQIKDKGLISTIPPGFFRDLNQLERLLIRATQISNLSVIDFNGLGELKWLSYNSNRISNVTGYLEIPKSLRYLVLESNGLRDIIDRIKFSEASNLIFLYLEKNRIEQLKTNGFRGLTNLRTLNLRHNSISCIINGAFSTLKNLKKLDLDDNKLTALDEYTFKGLHNLQYLSLYANRISVINVNTFSALTNLIQINLSMQEQDGLITIDLNAFPQFFDLQAKTVVYAAISSEPDDFEKKEMQWLQDVESYGRKPKKEDMEYFYQLIFRSFTLNQHYRQFDLHNLTQHLMYGSLNFGNLDLSYNRITSINAEKGH